MPPNNESKTPVRASVSIITFKDYKAYHHTTKEMGAFMRKHLEDVLHLPIRKQYEESIHISSGVGVYLMENYPEQFKEAAAIDEKRDKIVERINAIKKEFSIVDLQ